MDFYDRAHDAYRAQSARFQMYQHLKMGPNSSIRGKSYDDPKVQKAIDEAMLARGDFGTLQSGRDYWMFNAYINAKNDTSHPCWGASISRQACQEKLKQDYENRYKGASSCLNY